MRFANSLLFLIVLAVTSTVSAQTCYDTDLICVSEDDRIIRILDGDTLALLSTYEVPIDVIGFGTNVTGLTGVAYNNNTGQLFVLMITDQPPPLDIPYLAEVDLIAQLTFSVGPTGGLQFRELTFDDDNVLWTIAADFALLPNVHCVLDQSNAQPTDFCSLAAGDDSQGLAFDRTNDAMYHAAGTNNIVFEEVVTTTQPGSPCNVANQALAAPLNNTPLGAITFNSETQSFLWAANNAANSLYEFTPGGTPTLMGSLDFNCSGITERSPEVPCIATDSFVRGDVDGNGTLVGLLDGLALLNYQFAGGAEPPCLRAADADGNGGVVGLIDGLFILNYQFAGGPPPSAPFPTCGSDPTATVSCITPLNCP